MQALFQRKAGPAEPRHNADMQRGPKPKKEAPLFGRQLAHFRQQRGLTQYEFAEELGITRKLVVHYERSCENPATDFVVKAAKLLDVSVDELLGLRPAKERPGPLPRVKRVTERIAELPKAKQAIILEMLESWLGKAS